MISSGFFLLDKEDFDDLGLTKIGKKLVLKTFNLAEVPVDHEEQMASMSDEDFFKWLRSRGINEKDYKALTGKILVLCASATIIPIILDNGVTPPGFSQLDEEDFDDLGLTIIGKKRVLKTLAEVKAS